VKDVKVHVTFAATGRRLRAAPATHPAIRSACEGEPFYPGLAPYQSKGRELDMKPRSVIFIVLTAVWLTMPANAAAQNREGLWFGVGAGDDLLSAGGGECIPATGSLLHPELRVGDFLTPELHAGEELNQPTPHADERSRALVQPIKLEIRQPARVQQYFSSPEPFAAALRAHDIPTAVLKHLAIRADCRLVSRGHEVSD
jgi:hypothetical protein